MKEEIPKITEMMKELTRIKDKFTSKTTQDQVNDIIYELKDLRELCDFDK